MTDTQCTTSCGVLKLHRFLDSAAPTPPTSTEADRRVAEACDKERAEAKRCMAAEVQRRVIVELARCIAEGRREAE